MFIRGLLSARHRAVLGDERDSPLTEETDPWPFEVRVFQRETNNKLINKLIVLYVSAVEKRNRARRGDQECWAGEEKLPYREGVLEHRLKGKKRLEYEDAWRKGLQAERTSAKALSQKGAWSCDWAGRRRVQRENQSEIGLAGSGFQAT